MPRRIIDAVAITHPDRIVYPRSHITKAEVASYYCAMAEHILCDIAGRLLSVVRCPNGIDAAQFFQRHYVPGIGAHVHAVSIAEKSGHAAPYFYVADEHGLLELVQMDTIELHGWGAQAAAPDLPDRVVFDLDPGPGIAWESMVAAAALIRSHLLRAELQSFVRLTGGKGLHVVSPLERGPGWDEVGAFSGALARTIASEHPEVYVATASKARRAGRIFIDWLRNARGATTIANWSLRARPGAPVAVPLRWEELQASQSGADYDLYRARERAERLTIDPWEGFTGLRQKLPRY